MVTTLSSSLTKKAEQHLSRTDPVMRRLVKTHGACLLPMREYRPFDTLVGSIIGQQLSAKAASTIKGRVSAIVGDPFVPEALLQAKVEHLRSAGLSGAKVRYIRGLSERIAKGSLVLGDLTSRDNDSVIDILVDVPGIGRWTAEMFLIFGLKRSDVLALSDAGLQRAADILYGNSQRAAPILERVSCVWRPFRSVASWYLWKHLDGGD